MSTSRKTTTAAPELRFVVTGCARSGTKYTSHLLTHSGILTGHEDVFNRWAPGGGLAEDWRDGSDAYDGDSSFIAAPHAAELAEAGLTVVHLVRAPLSVIASICTMAWLADLNAPYVAYVAGHAPEVAEQPPGPRRAAAYWLAWNALAAEGAAFQWRTDTINEADILALANRTGVKFTRTRVTAALKRVSTTTNHKRETRPVDLDELGPLADDVITAAMSYGVPLGNPAEDVARDDRDDRGPLDDGTETESRTEAGA